MDNELDALKTCHDALEPLEQDVQVRTIHWLIDKYQLTQFFIPTSSMMGGRVKTNGPAGTTLPALLGRPNEDRSMDTAQGAHPLMHFETLADAFGHARPEANTEKALLVATWLKLREGRDEFAGQDINTVLKDLGHGVENITRTLGNLMEVKPQLVVQMKKAGTSKQARKTLKVTVAGVDKVKQMFNNVEA
jgi:hypothetical protein